MKVTKLKNGITVLIDNNQSRISVNILLLVNVGSRHEKKNKFGLAHYFEHLLFKGTKKYPKAKLITDLVYKYGGSVNAFTDYDITGYYIKINSKYTIHALSILSDIFFNSIFVDYIKEKDVVISENKKMMTNPQNFLRKYFENMIYKNTTYEHDVGGTNNHIKTFSMKDIKKFYNEYYITKNCFLSISGKIHKDINSMINKFFNKNKKNNIPKLIKNYDNFINLQKKPRFKSFVKKVDQAQIFMGFPCYNKQNKYKRFVLDIINIILGGNMSSKLFISLREKHGLVYTVYSNLDTYFDIGTFLIYFGTFNNKIKVATNLILKELSNIKKNGFSKDEIKQAIEFKIGNMDMNLENNFNNSLNNAYNYMLFKNVNTIQKLESIYKKITNKDIIEVANEIFNMNKINYCVLSNKKISNFLF